MLYCFWLVVWNVVAGPLCFVFKNLNESWKKVDLLYSYKALSTVMICCAQTYLLLFLSFLFDSVCPYYQASCLLFFSFLHFFQQSSKIGMQRVVTFCEWLSWYFFYSWLKFSKCCNWIDISFLVCQAFNLGRILLWNFNILWFTWNSWSWESKTSFPRLECLLGFGWGSKFSASESSRWELAFARKQNDDGQSVQSSRRRVWPLLNAAYWCFLS